MGQNTGLLPDGDLRTEKINGGGGDLRGGLLLDFSKSQLARSEEESQIILYPQMNSKQSMHLDSAP